MRTMGNCVNLKSAAQAGFPRLMGCRTGTVTLTGAGVGARTGARGEEGSVAGATTGRSAVDGGEAGTEVP